MGKRFGKPSSGAASVLLDIGLGAMGGILLGLALPTRAVPYLPWFCLAPLFVAAGRRNLPSAFGLGMISALAAAWVVAAPWKSISELGNLAGVFFVMGLVLGAAAAVFSLFSRRRMSPLLLAAVVAFAGTGAEYISQWIFPVNLAIIHSYALPLLQIVSVTGVWGLSFLVWFSSAAVAAVVFRPKSAHLLAFAAVPVLMVYVWGSDRAVHLPPNERVKVSAVQASSLFDLAKLTEQAKSQGASAVVWPELALDNLTQGVKHLSRHLDMLVVTGFTQPLKDRKPYNAAAVIDEGSYLGSYQKIHLLGREHGYFSPGSKVRVFRPHAFPTMGTAICFDTNFTGVTRKLALQGARVVFVPNSDPHTASGVLHFLHAALMPIRAAENSVIIVRADTSGLSEIVHPSGWVVSSVPIGQKRQITAEVLVGSGPTIYTKMGDWFAYLSLALTAAALYIALRMPHLLRRL